MNVKTANLFFRLGLLCGCIGLVGGAGVVMSESLAMRPDTAFAFAIAVAGLALVTPQMGRAFSEHTNSIGDIVSIVASGTLISGVATIIVLAVKMLTITGSPANVVFFLLILFEWVIVNAFA